MQCTTSFAVETRMVELKLDNTLNYFYIQATVIFRHIYKTFLFK